MTEGGRICPPHPITASKDLSRLRDRSYFLLLLAEESMLYERRAAGLAFTEPKRAAVRPGDEAGGAQPTQH